MRKDIKTLVNESFESKLSSSVSEAFGIFRQRAKTIPKDAAPLSANSWDMKSRYHRQMVAKHTELAQDFDEMGNREAGDFHTAAADAHVKAANALHHHRDDPRAYHDAADRAENASREANVFIKEDLNEVSEQHDKAPEVSRALDKHGYMIYKTPSHVRVEISKGRDGFYAGARKFDDVSTMLHTLDGTFSSKKDIHEVSYKDENGDTMYYYGDDKARAFKHIVDRHKHKETGTVNYRSAPDTSKFIAPAHGMIEHLRNVQIAREHPFKPHHFDHFIKIGSNVDRNTADAIKSDVHDYLMDTGHSSVDYKGNITSDLGNYHRDYIKIVDKDGNPYTLKTVSGTAWGGIGIVKGHD